MTAEIHRNKITVKGLVQGVGFRPFVYNLAGSLGLSGFIINTSQGVLVEVEGVWAALETFGEKLQSELPPQASISSCQSLEVLPKNETGFRILLSDCSGDVATLVSPDLATCPDCLAELFDPSDRRFLYPFINCTNCGPRHTIISAIPYDRPSTTMRSFTMCGKCREEYDDPANRRFHAQPNACPQCGPTVYLLDRDGGKRVEGDAAISAFCSILDEGGILAVKGGGGVHLAVDATNDTAVKLLRERKGRQEKPLAVMFPDFAEAEKAAVVSDEMAKFLRVPAAPIMLARKKSGFHISSQVSPHTGLLGIMLPYTPLHHIIFSRFKRPLVMTSGNLSEEPICIDNDEALARLGGIVDGFLLHNRDILIRSDDSVLMEAAGAVRFIRRSRGFVPRPILLASDGPQVLGVGGELKNTVCFLKEENGFVGQHHGDLQNLEAYGFFQETVTHLQNIFDAEPELVVHDLHPGYLSTRWAKEEQSLPTLAVQHHHAHLASCLAENREAGPAIGIILDGTGYGPDGAIWGGEILTGDCTSFARKCCFEPMLLPGGDAAIKAPWRTALSYLRAAYDGNLPDLDFLAGEPVAPILAMLEKKINCPVTTSCGRFFDAVAAISGGRKVIAYEGQAAIEFMEQASGKDGATYGWAIEEKGDIFHLSVRAIVRQVAEDVLAGVSRAEISGRFHRTLAVLLAEAAELVSSLSGLKKVVLSGGVFNNHLLLELLAAHLTEKGFQVLTHLQLPPGDGCISLGQAVIGRQYLIGGRV
ncbi:MAG: carbamoyltransferase HypF [Proteobacteria bacterium]|nr:carbamoyltransferase HypF [Pseudomonadota bacterium]